MTTQFTTFPFAASGSNQVERTLPERLSEVKNVKDFGAVGDGNADDHDAIMDAVNWQTASNTRCMVYFPPGTYYIASPIDISVVSEADSGPIVGFFGEGGASTIVGDFADYLIKRVNIPAGSNNGSGSWGGAGSTIQKLKFINRNANGGAIRLGAYVCYAVRDCDFTANYGINTANFDPAGREAYEYAIENCHFRPYTPLVTGSFGYATDADGPITNCTFTGFDTGVCLFGQEGAASIQGCYFKGNNIGLAPSRGPLGTVLSFSNFLVSGCRFKDNGIAIIDGGGSADYRGILIEASEGAIPGNPQYGIRFSPSLQENVFQGIFITGQYQQAGISIAGTERTARLNRIIGVGSFNTSTLSGVPWVLPDGAFIADFINCNVSPVFTVDELPAHTCSINSVSWSGGTATLVYTGTFEANLTNKVNLTVSGVTPIGYNGTFVGVGISYNTIEYTIADPGGPGTILGTIFVSGRDLTNDRDNVYEGYTYNVSDANTSGWGDAVTSGGGSNHVKVRYNPSSWSVMGK